MVQVRCSNTKPKGDSLQRHDLTRRFEAFVAALNECFGIHLRWPHFNSVGDIKKFCTGLLEGQSHPWRVTLRGLSATSRLSIAHSLFLFRKLIPAEKPKVGPYVDRMCRSQDPADPDFLRFAVDMTKRLFPVGWDRSYQDKCTTATLPITACFESGRRDGGCRGLDQQSRWSRGDFCQYVTESVVPRHRGPSRVQAVLTEGKWRIISIPPRVDNALRPLHVSLYDHITRQKWCLRGDAKPSQFKDFSFVEGEVFVSGDYELATDNLNSEVQHAIFGAALSNSRSIPRGIREHALSSFSSLLECGEGVSGVQQRGQLMGQLCSFPLLCLVNYIALKYFIRRDVPVRINGDDIVFRCTPQEYEEWRRGVEMAGLTLSEGKTMVHRKFFTLNSCVFRSGPSEPRFVPFVRPKAVWSLKEKECEKISSLSSRFYSTTVGFGNRRASVFRKLFLIENRSAIYRSRRSLTRGLGMKVRKDELIDTGLWHRELFYLEHVDEPKLPSCTLSRYKTNDIPTGWQQVSPRWYPTQVVKGWRLRHSFETVARAWSQPVISESSAEERWFQCCDEGVSPWGLTSFVNTKMRGLTGLSRRHLWRYVCLRRNASFFGKVRFERGKGCFKPGVKCDVSDSDEQGGRREVRTFASVAPPACLTV